jgi:hypothetical protein
MFIHVKDFCDANGFDTTAADSKAGEEKVRLRKDESALIFVFCCTVTMVTLKSLAIVFMNYSCFNTVVFQDNEEKDCK